MYDDARRRLKVIMFKMRAHLMKNEMYDFYIQLKALESEYLTDFDEHGYFEFKDSEKE